MIRIPIIIVLFFIADFIEGQNLVPNPGFEVYDELPDQYGQIDRATHWTSTSRDYSDFAVGTRKHGDYFHKNAPNPKLGIPYTNPAGFNSQKYTRSGNAMAGFVAYSSYEVNKIAYVQSPLLKKLVAGDWYYIEYYILKRPDRTWYIYSDAAGAAFSDSLHFEELDGSSALSLEPAIQNVSGLIRDTINWTRINGCYQAKGGESHLIIGNFKNTEETYVEKGHPTAGPWYIYYFIDDVSVIPMQRKSSELMLCENEGIAALNAAYWNADYLWNTGHTDSVLIVDEPGIYTVEVSLGDCFFTDTFVVHNTQSIEHWDQGDTTICAGSPLILESPVPGQLQWSTGDTTRSIEVQQSGLYTLAIDNQCGEYHLSKYVEVKDCKCQIYVPNAFSPNGDGINDVFEIFPHCDFELRIIQMEIYNRWGERVYYSSQPETNPWDGTFKGRELDPGPFTWRLEYEYLEISEWQKKAETGLVNIMK